MYVMGLEDGIVIRVPAGRALREREGGKERGTEGKAMKKKLGQDFKNDAKRRPPN